MPPPKTIIVDRSRILATIKATAAAQRAAVLAEREAYEGQHERLLRDAQRVPRDLPTLAGKPLTASERKRHQEAMKAMEGEGLIYLDTVWVKLTEAGYAAVEGSNG